MALLARCLASGHGWSVQDILCDAGPLDRPFTEHHSLVSIAAVCGGTFTYRTAAGAAVLASGSWLLGNHGEAYECGHDHSRGDRCLAFHFAPEEFEQIVRGVPGARRLSFEVASLPPLASLTAGIATAEAARDDQDAAVLEELALQLAAAAVSAAVAHKSPKRLAPRDVRRVSQVLHVMEERWAAPLSLVTLAGLAGMSRFHFLRTFRRIIGTTPYQYVLRLRLRRACVLLRRSAHPVAQIALEAGFDDLSTFNRQFRNWVRLSPSAYRAQRR